MTARHIKMYVFVGIRSWCPRRNKCL